MTLYLILFTILYVIPFLISWIAVRSTLILTEANTSIFVVITPIINWITMGCAIMYFIDKHGKGFMKIVLQIFFLKKL